jgi:hypothetical protein
MTPEEREHYERYGTMDMSATAPPAPREKRRQRSWDEWISASPVLSIVGLVLFVSWLVLTTFIPCQSGDPFYVCGMW